MMGYLRETKEVVTAQGRGAAGYSLYLGFCRGAEVFEIWVNRFGCSPYLLCSQHWEGRGAVVAVGRISHHCGVLSSVASLLP